MRHPHSEFHFRHALFALQGPDGYVDALLQSARGAGSARAAASMRRPRPRSAATECAAARDGFARAR